MRTWVTDTNGTPGPWLQEVVEVLAAGGVVALPTETFYGLAADSRNREGISRVLQLKGRAPDHPLLLLTHDCAAARQISPAADGRFDDLAAAFWPGPLTMILPPGEPLPAELTGPTGGVGVRVPAAAIPRQIARALGAPITGTSANLAGEPPAAAATEVDLDAGLLSGIVDGGATPGGTPSTLVDLTGAVARIVRNGAVPDSAIRKSLNGRLL